MDEHEVLESLRRAEELADARDHDAARTTLTEIIEAPGFDRLPALIRARFRLEAAEGRC